MKILYFAPLSIDFENLDGVPKKILCQAAALNQHFDIDIIYYFEKKVYKYNLRSQEKKAICSASSKISVIKAGNIIINEEKYDGAYIRYPKADYFFLDLLKKMKKKKMKIIVEIPTYPYNMEGNETLKGRIINLLDRTYRNLLKNYVDRIVTFSDDKEIFGIETINTINGIDFNSNFWDETELNVKEEIKLIAVSAMYRVHGYDRMIEGMHEYYENGGKRNIKLNLVGNGVECKKYKKLVKDYKLDNNVIFLGSKFGKEIEEIYKGSAVGINSLAIHRQGLKKESTLKTKEYAAKGLPIVSSSYVDAFSKKGNEKYVMLVPPDESSINISELINFIDKIYSNHNTSKIRNEIREDGRNVCDISITMKPVVEYFIQL